MWTAHGRILQTHPYMTAPGHGIAHQLVKFDAQTGHRVIRLSPDSGGGSLYFHQRGYTPEGDKVTIRPLAGRFVAGVPTRM